MDALNRNLLFVGGKGGVGKTAVSQAIARRQAARSKRTLWVSFEDPTRPMGELRQQGPSLWHLNCEASAAFEEYAGLKIGTSRLTQIFVQNKLMRYLSKAAPGIHELVLLGKVWHERQHYDHVVVDMPSTGYGLAMFQSTANFARLFKGGPVHDDAEAMLGTFADPRRTGHLIVSLPEEMPLVESLELSDYLQALFPDNPAQYLVNKRFPRVPSRRAQDVPASGGECRREPGQAQDAPAGECYEEDPPHTWEDPLAKSAEDFVRKRNALEAHNLRIWNDRKLSYGELSLAPPAADPTEIVGVLAAELAAKEYL